MSNLAVHWTEAELLADQPGLVPLVVAGYRCHGGIDADGVYQSPRSRFRLPAIAAWQTKHREDHGTELLDIGLDAWPAPSPNVAQSRYLLGHGVREPIIASLTRIGTVEGFGAAMRMWDVPDLQRFFAESIDGTTIAHLGSGMFEAQARDEAGWNAEYGHQHMWFAARDSAFEHPPVQDMTDLMLFRLGVTSALGAALPDPEQVRRRQRELQLFPALPLEIEALIQRMVGLLFIEISAAHLFSWAEELLADTDLVAGEGEAARIVSYIRQDESPHVEYLRTALSEMRDRTFIGESDQLIRGTDVITALWDQGLADSTGVRRENNLRMAQRELEAALDGHVRRDEILEGYAQRATPGPDGKIAA